MVSRAVTFCAMPPRAAVQVDYQKPPGFDRARNREVGKKDITLETMEEAFTSEHWIVRIFKARAVTRDHNNSDQDPPCTQKSYTLQYFYQAHLLIVLIAMFNRNTLVCLI